eukprot:snap_masked-scaffold_9-processed-gene-2.29-mRNA-1 protein AED:1.00 eAED:1.00 QI:0/-1/0/0/-1/1/1/0/128
MKPFKRESLSEEDSRIYLVYGVWVISVPDSFKHPGGSKLLQSFANGTDCSHFFNTTRGGLGHSDMARMKMKSFVIGYLTEKQPSFAAGELEPAKGIKCIDVFKNVILGLGFVLGHVVVFLLATRKDQL